MMDKAMNILQQTFATGPRPGFRLVCSILGMLLLAAPVTAADLDNGSLEGYIRTALDQNPVIRAARANVTAAQEKVGQAGVLPDPRVGFEYFLQPIETRTGPQEASISVSQSIPWPGRLSLDREHQQDDVKIIRAMLQDTTLQVVRSIKTTYIEYGYLGQAEATTGQILELMRYLEGIAQTNYTSGKSTFADVLKIQIEIARLENKLATLADNTEPVRVQLNSLLGIDRNMARPRPEELPSLSLSLETDQIHELARRNSPRLTAAREKIEKSRTAAEIADQGFYPDFSLSAKTIFTDDAEFGNPPDSGQDPVVVGLSVTIPIFYNKRLSAIAEKQAAVQSARHEREAVMKKIEAEIEQILFRYREAERLLDLYRETLIPKVRQELDVALEAYQGGEYTILELIDTEKNLLNFELNLLRARADMAIQIAGLEELTGATLADWDQTS